MRGRKRIRFTRASECPSIMPQETSKANLACNRGSYEADAARIIGPVVPSGLPEWAIFCGVVNRLS